MFSRFGDGYTVTLRIGGENPDLEGVSEFIKSLFPAAVLKVCFFVLSLTVLSFISLLNMCDYFKFVVAWYLLTITRLQLEPTICLTAYLHTSLQAFIQAAVQPSKGEKFSEMGDFRRPVLGGNLRTSVPNVTKKCV